mgnify:CR=1 FL=1
MQAEASLRGSLAAAADANPNRNLARTKMTARKSMQMMKPTTFNPGSALIGNKPMSTNMNNKPMSTNMNNKPMSTNMKMKNKMI